MKRSTSTYIQIHHPISIYVLVLYHQLNSHTSITKLHNALLTNFK